MNNEVLLKNYQTYLDFLSEVSEKEEFEKIKKMFEYYGEDYIAMTPLSIGTYNQDAEEGGFILHSLRAYVLVDKVINIYKSMLKKYKGIQIDIKRLKFLSLVCNVGKILDMEQGVKVYKLVEDNGKIKAEYNNTENNIVMKGSLRTLYLLSKYGINLSPAEYQAILHKDFFLDTENYNMFSKLWSFSDLSKNSYIYFLGLVEYMAQGVSMFAIS